MTSGESSPEEEGVAADEGAFTRPLQRGSASHFAGLSPGRWSAIALLVFALATLFLFRGLIGRDPYSAVPVNIEKAAADGPSETNWEALAETDIRFIVWMVARGAHALLHHPSDYFEAEQCHPTTTSLAYGESGIAVAILALPAYVLTGDPIGAFNGMLVLSTLIASFAMYLLVRDWTACPPAGIVAGLVYAFHIMKIGDMTHMMIWDTTWTVPAILFATRLFARGRWRDAIGLALSIGMQTLGSAYPLLSAALLSAPLIVWLLLCFGFRQLRVGQLVLVAAFVPMVAFLALGPYLAKTDAGQLEGAPYLAFFSIHYFMPDGAGFPGWIVLALVLAALVLGKKRTVLGLPGDPRWAVLVAGLLVFHTCVVYAGVAGQRAFPIIPGQSESEGLFNLYLLLADWIPGLEVGRGAGALYGGVHLVVSLLAGIGAAGVLRLAPPARAGLAAAALIGLAWLDVASPPMLGLSPAFEFEVLDVRPSADALALFDALESEPGPASEAGALLEYPVKHINFYKASKGVLLSAYHHRRTSYCYNSVLPRTSRELEVLAARLPDPQALHELHALGFDTLVMHHEHGALGGALHRRQIAALDTGQPDALLRRIAGNDSLTAYRILP